MEQRPFRASHRQAWLEHTKLLDVRQGACVANRIAADFHGTVIAADLAFVTDSRGNPPDGRVVEEQGLHDGLQNVDEEVLPPDVCKFVREYRFELLRCQPDHHGGGQ